MPAEERLILPCLQRIQAAVGYVSEESLDVVAEFLNVSRAEVVGVVSYYHDLRRTPPPAVIAQVCVAEACQAQGARSLWSEVQRETPSDCETPSDAVEFAKVYCLGNCALGPAAMVNGRLIGRCDIATLNAAVAAAR